MEKNNPFKLEYLKNDDNREELEIFLWDLMEYFEDRQDANMEDGHYIPNDAMKMLIKLNDIFGIRQC